MTILTLNQTKISPSDHLNRNLAAAMDLHVRCKHAHWNCIGPNFIGVHRLFDELAASAEGYADTMAEQARYLGAEANGTAKTIAGSFLGPYSVGVSDTTHHLTAILSALTTLAESTRLAISDCLRFGDQVTADIFIETTRALGKDIYLVRSHLR